MVSAWQGDGVGTSVAIFLRFVINERNETVPFVKQHEGHSSMIATLVGTHVSHAVCNKGGRSGRPRTVKRLGRSAQPTHSHRQLVYDTGTHGRSYTGTHRHRRTASTCTSRQSGCGRGRERTGRPLRRAASFALQGAQDAAGPRHSRADIQETHGGMSAQKDTSEGAMHPCVFQSASRVRQKGRHGRSGVAAHGAVELGPQLGSAVVRKVLEALAVRLEGGRVA
jgi:hypothetical protein